jgi:hypothetical protein
VGSRLGDLLEIGFAAFEMPSYFRYIHTYTHTDIIHTHMHAYVCIFIIFAAFGLPTYIHAYI